MSSNHSFWCEQIADRTRPPLLTDLNSDVCIVGAGIAGLSAAYLLQKEGFRVVVLDDGPLGGGQTEVTTAHLSCVPDRRFAFLRRAHGEEGVQLAYQSHAAAIDKIESITTAENIDCDFTRLDAYLFLAPEHLSDLLDDERDAAHAAGFHSVERLPWLPWTAFAGGACLRFPHQGQFHPLKYLLGLAKAFEAAGGKIFGRTHVAHVEGGDSATIKTTAGRTVHAGSVIVATNSPINDLVTIHTKQAPYLSYVIGMEIDKGAMPKALLWDTADPFHYVRTQTLDDEHDLLIVGGEDHKTGQADDGEERFGRLESWLKSRFSEVGKVRYRWAGQVMESVDGLAFIGRNPLDAANVYIATGDSGLGMTHGTIAGMLLTDLIVGESNPWKDLYDPSRKPLSVLSDFAAENLNVAAQYASWATPGEVASAEDVPRGHGAIVRKGLTKVAVFRDEYGHVEEMSAVCPHLMCIVHWNGSEQTWDCPCHGSRFDCHGHVLNGPANVDLTPAGETVKT